MHRTTAVTSAVANPSSFFDQWSHSVTCDKYSNSTKSKEN